MTGFSLQAKLQRDQAQTRQRKPMIEEMMPSSQRRKTLENQYGFPLCFILGLKDLSQSSLSG